jgi:tetratricopeptide (TPR) repeat protein
MPFAAVLLLVLANPQDAPAPTPPPPPEAVTATDVATPSPAAEAIAAGQKAFVRHRFRVAQADFEKAMAADPQSAAAAFYLGYTFYKLGEPQHRMNDNKQKARELFAKAFSLDPGFRPDWGRPAAPK